MRTFVASALVAGLAAAAGGEFDYMQNGRNWGDLCASGSMQSPINLDRRKETKLHNLSVKVEGYAHQNNLQVNVNGHPTGNRIVYYANSALKVDLVPSENAGHDNIEVGAPTMMLKHPF
jgi:carbonic anhydrase